MDRKSLDGRKPCNYLGFLYKHFEKYFQMDYFIDKRGIQVIFCIRLLKNHKSFQNKNQVTECTITWLCIKEKGPKLAIFINGHCPLYLVMIPSLAFEW